MCFFLVLLIFFGIPPPQAQAQSTDATLSNLTISDGTFNFDSETSNYAVGVANDITRITVEPTTTHGSATVSYKAKVGTGIGSQSLDITDADSNTAGFQVDLAEGVTYLRVIVTAEDGSTTKTYLVKMYRDSTETCTPTLATGRTFIWMGRLVVGAVKVYSTPITLTYSTYGWIAVSGEPHGVFIETDLTFNIRGEDEFEYQGHGLDDYEDNSHNRDGRLRLILSKGPSASAIADLQFHACGDTLAFSDAAASFNDRLFTWTDTSLDWSTTIAHDLYLSMTNAAPEFSSTSETRSFSETKDDTTVTTAEDLGAEITATDADSDTLTYSLEGTGAEKFTIDSSSGQISTKVGENYDYEANSSYSLIVKADDELGGTDTVPVTINVTDIVELPVINPPRLSSDTTIIYVYWIVPTDAPVTSYDIQYREAGGPWISGPQGIPPTMAITTIIDLMEDTEYHVQIRARNSAGTTDWTQERITRTLIGDMPEDPPDVIDDPMLPPPPPPTTPPRVMPPSPPLPLLPPVEEPVEPEPMPILEPELVEPEPEPVEIIDGSGGCSITSSDGSNSIFDLLLFLGLTLFAGMFHHARSFLWELSL